MPIEQNDASPEKPKDSARGARVEKALVVALVIIACVSGFNALPEAWQVWLWDSFF